MLILVSCALDQFLEATTVMFADENAAVCHPNPTSKQDQPFLQLPIEMFLYILELLDADSLLAVSTLNKSVNEIASSLLWRSFSLTDRSITDQVSSRRWYQRLNEMCSALKRIPSRAAYVREVNIDIHLSATRWSLFSSPLTGDIRHALLALNSLETLFVRVESDSENSWRTGHFVSSLLTLRPFDFQLRKLTLDSGLEADILPFLTSQPSIEEYHIRRGSRYPTDTLSDTVTVHERVSSSLSNLPNLLRYEGPPLSARLLLRNRQLQTVHILYGMDDFDALITASTTAPLDEIYTPASCSELILTLDGFVDRYEGNRFPLSHCTLFGIDTRAIRHLTIHYSLISCTGAPFLRILEHDHVYGFRSLETMEWTSTLLAWTGRDRFDEKWAIELTGRCKAAFPALHTISFRWTKEVVYTFTLVEGSGMIKAVRDANSIVIPSTGDYHWVLTIYLPRLRQIYHRNPNVMWI